MAEIIINEISQNYLYNVGDTSFATVALPITASWGPGLFAKLPEDITEDDLDALQWNHFTANQAGLDAFVTTYRSPTSVYRIAKDNSYQMAISLISAGYDVLVCRVGTGNKAKYDGDGLKVEAKYPGTFGNQIGVDVKLVNPATYNVIVYVIDVNGGKTAVENATITTELTSVSDSVIYIDEFESNYIIIETLEAVTDTKRLAGGTDYQYTDTTFDTLWAWYQKRYGEAYSDVEVEYASAKYPYANTQISSNPDKYRVDELSLASKYPGAFGNATNATLFQDRKFADDATLVYKYTVDEAVKLDKIDVTYYGSIAVEAYTTTLATTAFEGTGFYHTLTISHNSITDVEVSFVTNAEWATETIKYWENIDIPHTILSVTIEDGVVADEPVSTLPLTVSDDPTYILEVGNTDVSASEIIETLQFKINTIDDVDSKYISLEAINEEASEAADIPGSVTLSGVNPNSPTYANSEYALKLLSDHTADSVAAYKQAIYSLAFTAYDSLYDKLTYRFEAVITPGWDDQDISEIGGEFTKTPIISALHCKLMDVGFYSRCGTAFLDIPKALPRRFVWDDSTANPGYAQKLSKRTVIDDDGLYTTHSTLVVPWGQYTYAGTSKPATASPAFQALLIIRAMILNQSIQYWWCLPTNRSHNLKLGKFDYTIPAKLLKQWQQSTGVGVNCITSLPDLGNTLWGNSTLFDVPPATYQALADLSTRNLFNAVEDIVYRCGVSITFQYNNGQAYDKFYAGVTPLLDTMKNVGALKDYRVRMSQDIDSLGQVRARSVIGAVYLKLEGVVNDIKVDLVALPPQTDLNQFGE